MQRRRVVVVAETQSLARSLGDLLRAAGFIADTVTPLEALETFGERAGPMPSTLLLVASNRRRSETASRWARGEFPGAKLIVVGLRDPSLVPSAGGHFIDLPLRPEQLLELVRLGVSAPDPVPGAQPS